MTASNDPFQTTTGAQLRAARALLELSEEAVAERTGLSPAAVAAAEADDPRPNAEADRVTIREVLAAAGAVFLSLGEAPDGGAGVRLRRPETEDDGMRPDELNAANDD